jgi:hypothetical protein
MFSNFLDIEYHYDQIKHGSLILSDQSRNRFYIIFLIITILIIIISFFGIYIVCTSRSVYHYPTHLELIIDTQMARQEAARRAAEAPQDGAVGNPVHIDVKEGHVNPGDM